MKRNPTSLRARILAMTEGGKLVSTEEAAEATQVDIAIIRRELQAMIKAGHLVVARRGRPSLYAAAEDAPDLPEPPEHDPEPTIPGARIVAARHTQPTGPGASRVWHRPEGAPC